MQTFSWTPDKGLTREVTPRVNAESFGDGYEQRIGDGINTQPETWAMSFTLRTMAEIRAIEDFLEALDGRLLFEWTTPRGQIKNFVCKSWTSSYNHDYDSSLSCKFEQRFEV